MREDAALDIIRLLGHTFQNSGYRPLPTEELCRIWSLDLSWMGQEEAEEVARSLAENGWLKPHGEGLEPAFKVKKLKTLLGWVPRMTYITSPPSWAEVRGWPPEFFDNAGVELIPVGTNPPKSKIDMKNTVTEASSRPPPVFPVLLKNISSASGLPRQEVSRRIMRKRRALGAVTTWMAALLLAREQGLSIKELLPNLNAVDN